MTNPPRPKAKPDHRLTEFFSKKSATAGGRGPSNTPPATKATAATAPVAATPSAGQQCLPGQRHWWSYPQIPTLKQFPSCPQPKRRWPRRRNQSRRSPQRKKLLSGNRWPIFLSTYLHPASTYLHPAHLHPTTRRPRATTSMTQHSRTSIWSPTNQARLLRTSYVLTTGMSMPLSMRTSTRRWPRLRKTLAQSLTITPPSWNPTTRRTSSYQRSDALDRRGRP